MTEGCWTSSGLSPFLSERARRRAPQILSFAAVTGAALLVSPAGNVVLSSGATADIDVHHIARDAGTRGGAATVVSFAAGSMCVYAGPIAMGWMLCVLSAHAAQPADVVDRLRRASAVLALALADGIASSSGEGGSGPAGAPAEIRRRRSKPGPRSANGWPAKARSRP